MIERAPFAAAYAIFVAGGLAVVFFRAAWIVQRPRAVLVGFAALCVAGAVSLVRLDPPGLAIDVDPASEPLIARHDPGRAVYAQAKLDFGNDDLYVIAMETADSFTRENLEVLRRLTQELLRIPGVASVESLARVLSIRWDAALREVRLGYLMDSVPEGAAARAALKARALADPIYRKTLISADGRTAAINISFQPMTDTEFVARDIDGRIEELVEAVRAPGRRFYIAGRPHVRSEVHHVMVADLLRLVPLAVATAAFALWLMSGTAFGVLIPLLACLAATLWVYAVMALLAVDVNLITLVLGPMMICIGSVYGVHVHARHQLIAAGRGDPKRIALAALEYVRKPVAMAGLTTCIGFGALLLTDVPATRDLGYFAIIGVAAVSLISLTAVPAALALLPVGAAGQKPGRLAMRSSEWLGSHMERLLDGLGRFAVRRSGSLLVFWAAVTIAAILLIPRTQVDTDFITFFDETSPVRSDFEAVNRLLAGVVPIDVTISGTGEGAFRDPATLAAVAQLQSELEAVPGVSEVLSSVDLIRVANQAMMEGAESEARIPDTRAALAELTFLLPKDKLRRFTTSNHSRANLIVRSGRSGSAAVRDLEARIRAVLQRVRLPAGFSTDVIGNTILLNRSADGIAGHQATQVGFAAAGILVLIVAVFRSLRVAWIALVPNVVPVIVFFGILGLGAAPLSLPTSLIGSIALGIAVDDTMHFLFAYSEHRTSGCDAAAAIARCMHQVGRPIVMTSVMLVVGFLVIVTSGFATLREFGSLTALTMAICLCSDLLLLPALLARFRA